MAIRFQCGSCSQPIEVDDEWASKTVACPYCRKTITAPAESTIGDVSRIPIALPVAPGQTASAQMEPVQAPPVPYPDASLAYHPNRIALVALALACGEVVLLIAMQWVMASNRLEAEELMKTLTPATSFSQILEAQSEFFKSRGGVPRWMIAFSLLELTTGLNWIALVTCGIIGVRRTQHRASAIVALIISGLVPIFFCCGGFLLGGGS